MRPLLLAALALGGCTSPQPLEVPRQGAVTVEGNTVIWTTSEPTLGTVRYGTRAGVADVVAYPAAASRADRAYVTTHRVPLLSVAAGDTVWIQAMDAAQNGTVTVGPPVRLRIASRPATRPLLAWTMIDVGFGDSHLITTPSGERVLVDAGERRDWPNVDRFLAASGIARLDVVLATHIHEDHIGGMVGESADPDDGVLGAYDVGAYLDSPTHSGDRYAYTEALGLLARRAIPRRVVNAGDTDATNAALAWDPAVRVQALNSGGGSTIGGLDEGDWINNDSIVLRIGYADVQLVLGGDAEGPVQTRLVAAGAILDSEVLKVHHHGHGDSGEPAYLAAVNPRAALIPITVYETYNGTLPSGIVLDRLRQRRADIYCSDRAEPLGIVYTGDAGQNVTVVTDGTSYEVRVSPSASRHYLYDAYRAALPPAAIPGAQP